MARKRSVFFCRVQSFLKKVLLGLMLTLVIVLGHPAVGLDNPNLISQELSLVNSQTQGTDFSTLSGDAQQLVNEGIKLYQAGRYEEALNKWRDAAHAYEQINNESGETGKAISLINQAQAWEKMGFSLRACETLTQALQFDYEVCHNPDRQHLPKFKHDYVSATGLRILGDVLRDIGNLEISQKVLEQTCEIVKGLSSNQQELSSIEQLKVDVLLSLGNTARALGNRERNRNYSIGEKKETEEEEKFLSAPTERCSRKQNLEAIDYYYQAINYYKMAMNCPQPNSSIASIDARLNRLSLLLDIEWWFRDHGQKDNAKNWVSDNQIEINELSEIKSTIDKLPPSREAIYTKINLAQILTLFHLSPCENPQICSSNNDVNQLVNNAKQLLNDANQQAEQLKDRLMQAYTMGYMGWIYEKNEQYQEALLFTKQALDLAEEAKEREIIYQWQWQLGRIYKKLNKFKEARDAYQNTINNVRYIRDNLQLINSDAQLFFRDRVESIYRDFVDLILKNNKNFPDGEQKALLEAIIQVQELEVFELQKFLNCLESKKIELKSSKIEIKDIVNNIVYGKPTAVAVFPIVLDDRLEVILKSPDSQKLRSYSSFYSSKENRNDLEFKIKELQKFLLKADAGIEEWQPISQYLYDLLIRPAEDKGYIKPDSTLVFVLDGSLKNIPMSVLMDGNNKYLIEKYAVAIAPTLGLSSKEPQEPQEEPKEEPLSTKLLIAGWTTSQQKEICINEKKFSFNSIKAELDDEINNIKKIVPNTDTILGNNFKTKYFRRQLNSSSYSIVHLATHGNFSSNPQETFLLTSDELINVYELSDIFKSKQQTGTNDIQLLVLSACQTAKGDRWATLGLAGIAEQTGAHSTLATLWSVDSKSTSMLMPYFYENLVHKNMPKANISKAEALRQAQLTLMHDNSNNYRKPYFWAPFIIIGDWR